MDIYEPREHSFLLERWAKKLAKGRCLDMGCGSGIQSKAALKNCSEVIGVDINPTAVTFCRKHVPGGKFYVSDLFSYFDEQEEKRKFDTIIFNAPYLPNEGPEDAALDGGREGYEITARFLKEAARYLAPEDPKPGFGDSERSKEGQILLMFSSLTGKGKIEKEIKKNKMRFEELERKHIFFEDIFCCRVTWN